MITKTPSQGARATLPPKSLPRRPARDTIRSSMSPLREQEQSSLGKFLGWIVQGGIFYPQKHPAMCREAFFPDKSILQHAGRQCLLTNASCNLQEGIVRRQKRPARGQGRNKPTHYIFVNLHSIIHP